MKKQSIIYTISAFLLISGLFLSLKSASADVTSFQIIDLESGWNIFSTPRVLTNHEFSVPETSSNFDIYLLNPSSPSGWQTMQGAGQTEFTPLYAYFVNNKTGQNQTLTLNHNLNLTPDQRLFQRALHPGWNAIGVASPSYAIPRGTVVADTNNPSKILSSIINSTGSVIDFRSREQLIDSLKISDSWTQMVASDVNNLSDFREYKGYGIFITSETNNYNGMQNNGPTVLPPEGCATITEGSYTATLSSTPVSRTVTGGSGIEAYGINIKAADSNITIEGLDLQMSVIDASTAVVQNPETFISGIKVYKDSFSSENLVAAYASPSFTLDASSVYYTSLTGLNMKVLNGDTNKLLIALDTIENFNTNKTVILNVYGNGIKGKDCASIDRSVALAITRTLTVQHPNIGTLTITAAADNPNSDNIKSDATNGVQTKETLLSLNAKATGGDATLMRLEIGYGSIASTAVPSALYLYDGDTLISAVTPTFTAAAGDLATFETFRLPIAQDVVKNLKVKANWNTTDSGQRIIVISTPASTAGNATGGSFERAGGQQVGILTAAAIAANPKWVTENGLKYTFVSGIATYTPTGTTAGIGTATGSITFKVKPFGGTLAEPAYASGATTVAAGIITSGMLVRIEGQMLGSGGMEAYASGVQLAIARSLTVTPAQNITEDQEATVTVTMSITSSGTETGALGAFAGYVKFKVEDICADVNTVLRCQGSSSGATWIQTGNLTDNWVTNSVYMVP